ncbi:4'-phosphopantetheinyl transferase family protein [Kordia sp.]|uniref:4'-phosphopantetheinyl transferase family protein n=1 Tax=Kordia sp. TaxID=1965332 RepID=UPI003D2B50D7
MIYIYYTHISEQKHELLLQNFLPNFPLDFQQKIRSYRRWQDAQSSVLGRLLLKYGISKNKHLKTVNSKILFNTYNKPYFENKEVNFNISHSGEIVICAISESHDIGIDIETMNTININDFKMQMTDYEWNLINNASDQQAAFYNYWTQKEAVVKAHGKGLSIPLQSFEIKANTTEMDSKLFYTSKIKLAEKYTCYVASTREISKENSDVHTISIEDILLNI